MKYAFAFLAAAILLGPHPSATVKLICGLALALIAFAAYREGQNA